MSWQLRQILPDAFASAYTSDDDHQEDFEGIDGHEEEEHGHDGNENDFFCLDYEGQGSTITAEKNDGSNTPGVNYAAVQMKKMSRDNQSHQENYAASCPTETTPIIRKYKKTKKKPMQFSSQPTSKKDSLLPKSTVQILPRSLKHRPYERFFAALLKSSAREYVMSQPSDPHVSSSTTTTMTDTQRRQEQPQLALWTDICRRVNLKPITEPIKAKYHEEHEHFAVRAALVLEESRCAIADEMAKRWSSDQGRTNKNNKQRRSTEKLFLQKPKHSRVTMRVRCEKVLEWDHEVERVSLTFRLVGTSNFTKDQLFSLRPGTVMEIFSVTQNESSSNNGNIAGHGIDDTFLGCLAYGSREEIERERVFTVMVFSKPSAFSHLDEATTSTAFEKLEFEVTAVAGLISELRQFEACTNVKVFKRLLFSNALLGHWPKHIRFLDSDDESINDGKNHIGMSGACAKVSRDDESSTMTDDLLVPSLNPTQEKAAKQFLGSSPGSITLVQGPPGTGKSTLLVSTICRYLLAPRIEDSDESSNKSQSTCRLMVCAPTNKAVTVVASRFLNATCQNNANYNVIMVGDADKLLDGDDASDQQGQASQLKSIFVYTWKSEMIRMYKSLRQMMVLQQLEDCTSKNGEELYDLARGLYQRLTNSLPKCGSTHKLAKNICESLDPEARAFETADIGEIDDIIDDLSSLDDVHQALLTSANIIFCTLATAGSSIFKRIPKVDDLIIDEASAATEPELYIPFHLKPRRLLVVGDPNQLPATVKSRQAVALGFDKSFHERLMHDCGCSYTMLDVQYRMNPGISQFPSKQFYKNMIMNGPNVCSQEYRTKVPLLCGKPFYFLQVDGHEEQSSCGSYRNHAEAQRIVDLIQNLRTASLASGEHHHYHHWHTKEKVRIITFYSAQVALLNQILSSRGLSQVLVATVDSSQGCESDIVIVSFVRSNAKMGRGNSTSSMPFLAGFLKDERRMNVALTRAKHQLICVGNVEAMKTTKPTSTLYELASSATERNCVLNKASTSRTGDQEFGRKRKLLCTTKQRRKSPRP